MRRKATRVMRQLLFLTLTWATLSAAPPDYKQALHLYNRTEYAASLQLLLRVRDPDTPALLLIGQNYFMMGDANRAAEFFQQAVTADPNNSIHYHWLGRAYARQAEAASMFNAFGLATKSRQNLEKAIELDRENIDAIMGTEIFAGNGAFGKLLDHLVAPRRRFEAPAIAHLSAGDHTAKWFG